MESPRPIVVVAGRSRPHELLLLGLSLLSGISYLLGAPPPGSITALMPAWEVHAWAAGLLASGLVGLVGCWWRGNHALGLGLEMGAMLIGSGALLLYSVAAFSLGGWRALFAGGIGVTWMAANLWRAGQIRYDLRQLGSAT